MMRALVAMVLLVCAWPAETQAISSIKAPACFSEATTDRALRVFEADGLEAADRLFTNLIEAKQCVTIEFHIERAQVGQSATYREYEATVVMVQFLEGRTWYAFVVIRSGRSA